MRFLITLLFLAFALSQQVQAQQTVALQRQPDSAAFLSVGLFQQRLFSFYERAPGQVLFHPASGYSLSTAGMARTQGNWRTPQLAEKRTQYELASTGVSQINKFRLWGNFSYTRRQEDSAGWRLKANPHDLSPYYLANIKPGNWDVHDYKLQGAGGVPVTERLSLVAGAKLQVGTYGRFTDPRPEISNYRLRLEAGVGYQIQNVQLVLSGIYGYADEETVVKYQDITNRAEGKPTYIVHDVMGYGYYRVVSETKINLYEDQKITGITAVVQAGDLNLAYTFEQTERKYTREVEVAGNISPYKPLGDVTQEDHSLVSSFRWGQGLVKRLVGAEVQQIKVKDQDYRIIQGNNYLGVHRRATLSYFEQRPVWEYGASVNFQSMSKKDGTAAVDYLVQTASLKAEASKRISLGANFLQLNGHVTYRTDLNSKLTIGSQYNDFMRGVVLPDFTYYSSNLVEPGLSLGYGLKVKSVLLLPTFGYQLQKPLAPTQFSEAAYVPRGTARSYFVQLNVHL